ncbi:hypothetical protein BATDEDRAFT_35511 [Batrachochytrium dendrobatidis JAM81]|uniref:DUF885 domain-containing protein n=3 Tax=Batrachochytrium dendrobatidis TaxID=109871 RepID=F4P779_BATDJ|nr:uncharacterized protein BATDEDRAFT_35511 [Batrachochytrium dendrobatidis JAM81]EGF78837.1 hypothetical protein BATDEDRAFT_35511 [Batrachochytrium dendrobatidis JAM81]OAJ42352.1 hypothetical protein BDEG_25811 [Batrachochytrium dendrobatidis JEL423]|eukprot:XP_006680400.1 hypothetical protein BATDEDRAFT_35511 [Batrachochytrium dendrobatidis JAM81]
MLSCLPFFRKHLKATKPAAPVAKTTVVTGTPDASKELVCIMDDFMELFCQSAPEYSPIFGLDRYPDEIFNSSKEFHEKNIGIVTKLSERAEAIDASQLSIKEKDDLKQVKGSCTEILLSDTCYGYEIPATHMYGAFASFHSSISAFQSLKTVKDAENYVTRIKRTPERFGHCIDAYRAGIAKKITLPAESIKLMIDLCGNMAVADPTESIFHQLFKEKFVAIDLPEDYAIAAIRDYLVPAYTSVKVFLESEYLPHARSTAGIYSLADSQRVYNDLIYLNTTVRYTADELHQLGLKEVSRIRARMEETKSKVFDGTYAEFLVALKDKKQFPQLYFASPDDCVPYYKDLIKRIDKKMPELFSKFPKFECDVKSVPPAAESSSPIAFYQPGTAEKTGTFSTNLLLSKDSPRHSAMALTLHEANPGHHHQVSLALEMPVSHTFLKTVSNTAYVEGWGLYSEFLGEEMEMYDTPYDLFGRLELEMFRALRLVVDTGLHTLGWTVDKCVETMSEQLSMSHEEIVSEVRRYSIMPGQALAYKVGEIKIREVRSYAETALGSKFDLRAFHDVVLDHGSVRLETLELNVKEWVQCILTQCAIETVDVAKIDA